MAIGSSERIKNIQRRLGLKDDGIIGPVTLTRLEAVLDQALGPSVEEPLHNLLVSQKGIDLLVEFEISSETYYNRRLRHPVWPGGASGITIGIGYDLGYNSPAQIRREWQGRIADRELEALQAVARKRGDEARALLDTVGWVDVPLEAARKVFFTSTLPKYALMTREAYPGVEKLPADAQAMLLSLVYNRGTRMSGSSRREMKEIQDLVPRADLAAIALQVRAMKRLWDKQALAGLHTRRDKEAAMIESAAHPYPPADLVQV